DNQEYFDCTVTARLEPSKLTPFHPRVFEYAKRGQRIEIKLRRFGENAPVANQKAYLATVDESEKLPVRDDITTATPAGSAGVAVDPRFDADDPKSATPSPVLDPATHHYIGKRRAHVPGNARLDLSRNFTDAANVDLSFVFNDGDFGDQGEKGTVTADKYKMSVFGG